MKLMFRLLFCGLLLTALAPPVWAQNPGPYLGLFGGGHFLVPAKSEDNLGTFNLEYRPAPTAGIVLGWELETGSKLGEGRVEIEFSRRRNRLDRAEFKEGKVRGGGDLISECILLNTFGVYRSASTLTPYLGAGIGMARISAVDLQITGQPLTDDEAFVFAYQFGAGAEVEVTQALTLDFGYRLFGSSKAKFEGEAGRELRMTYLGHSAILGVRYGF